MSSAVVLTSGGIDSATVLEIALRAHRPDWIHMLSFKYGSKHNDQEGLASLDLYNYYNDRGENVTWQQIELPDLFTGANSALMPDDAVDMPQLSYKQIHAGEGPSPTVVPFRNANLLSMATTIALTHEASHVYAGMHGDDAHGFAYPDCTPEFLGSMAAAIYVGSYHKVQLKFPLIWMMKADVIRLAHKYGVPANLTWSCYQPITRFSDAKPGEPRYVHCGLCPTCIERIDGFKKLGVVDPVDYAITVDFGTAGHWVPQGEVLR